MTIRLWRSDAIFPPKSRLRGYGSRIWQTGSGSKIWQPGSDPREKYGSNTTENSVSLEDRLCILSFGKSESGSDPEEKSFPTSRINFYFIKFLYKKHIWIRPIYPDPDPNSGNKNCYPLSLICWQQGDQKVLWFAEQFYSEEDPTSKKNRSGKIGSEYLEKKCYQKSNSYIKTDLDPTNISGSGSDLRLCPFSNLLTAGGPSSMVCRTISLCRRCITFLQTEWFTKMDPNKGGNDSEPMFSPFL